VDAVTTAPPPPPPPIAAPTVAPSAEAAGERRHVTVMFCDLVDSTGICSKLDAEEWRDLVGAYLDAASAAVTDMGGKVAKKLGDGLMTLFGYPVAQENDAERAVRAALFMGHFPPCTRLTGATSHYAANSSSSAFASFRSRVSNPSVNHP
jgi:hypothetical protein